MRYFSYCFISINDILLVVICHSSPVVSGFSGNEFNSRALFCFSLFFVMFYLVSAYLDGARLYL
jgi:hypothetical protein